MFIDKLKQNLKIRNQNQNKKFYNNNNDIRIIQDTNYKQNNNNLHKPIHSESRMNYRDNFFVTQNYKDNSIFQSKKISSLSNDTKYSSSIINFSDISNNTDVKEIIDLLNNGKINNSDINGGYIGNKTKIILGKFKKLFADYFKSNFILSSVLYVNKSLYLGSNNKEITYNDNDDKIIIDGNVKVNGTLEYENSTSQSNSLFEKNTTSTPNFINPIDIQNILLIGHNSLISDTTDILQVNGDAYFSSRVRAMQFRALSDKRLKKKIKIIKEPNKIIKKMRGVTFNWKTTDNKSSGVIAQEIEKILPEAVENNNDYKTVDYNCLSGYFIEGIKENNKIIKKQDKIIKNQSKTIVKHEKIIEKQSKEIEMLKKQLSNLTTIVDKLTKKIK